jgi:hypothetical protein
MFEVGNIKICDKEGKWEEDTDRDNVQGEGNDDGHERWEIECEETTEKARKEKQTIPNAGELKSTGS